MTSKQMAGIFAAITLFGVAGCAPGDQGTKVDKPVPVQEQIAKIEKDATMPPQAKSAAISAIRANEKRAAAGGK